MSTPAPPIYVSSQKSLYAAFGTQPTLALEGPCGLSRAALIADLAAAPNASPLLVVCSDDDEVQKLKRELGFFLGLPDEAPDFFGLRRIVSLLPDEVSPYESRKLAPDKLRRMELLAGLYCLTQPFRPAIAITSARGLLHRYPPKAELLAATPYLLAGADINRMELLRALAQNGYSSTPIVEDPGTFSARGGIVDVFSPLYRWPLRLEFMGDTLESIRLFNSSTQKSLGTLEEAYLTPVLPFFLRPDKRRETVAVIERTAREAGRFDRRLQAVLIDLEEGLYSPELEPYTPLFYEEMPPLFAYLAGGTRVVLDDPLGLEQEQAALLKRLETQFTERQRDEDLALPPKRFVLLPEELKARLSHISHLELHRLRTHEAHEAAAEMPHFHFDDHAGLRQELATRRGKAQILLPLIERLNDWLDRGQRVFLVAHTEVQLKRLAELLAPHHVRSFLWNRPFPEVFASCQRGSLAQINLVVGQLGTGQIWPAEGVVFLCEEEIFGERKRRAPKALAFDKEAFLTSLDELAEGDFIVHVEFGVGVYRGLKHLTVGGVTGDFLDIEYSSSDKLYLPITRLEKVQKFSGAEGQIPHLDRLGSNRWALTKGKIKAAIMEMANELIALYAKRAVAEGYAFTAPDAYYREFEAAFPYEETPDQEQAIADVLRDMQSAKPMDRLVCGDVGFGKTEVALRAAFKAVLDNKQVALLVPTTILALQHGETFAKRLKDYPVRIGVLSRFKTAAEQKELIKQVKSGFIDIIIGTHRLLSKDVSYANLGLLIIDEEHRFGVAHKERIKQMRSKVDVLTLTATPIPRTLNMSFLGVRDISIIRTPPTDRLSVRTFVAAFDEEVIREAISNELSRGGQVFFVHNRIGSIQAMGTMIKNLVPQARVVVAHGQMSEEQLETIMLGFMHKETNVLVSTTIIESGIDIPSVNTMLVNRADTFGLAQLYQLRGRVGRGAQRGYAYLLVPSPNALTKDAQKRLAVLMRYTELGSGFRIASHDLEIRGAGNLLGKQQSGQIAAVGIDLYLELMEEAVRELKGEKTTPEIEPQVNFYLPAYLPDSYIEDAALRLHFYKRLSAAHDVEALLDIVAEIEDRFGRLPEEAQTLQQAIELKILLRAIRAEGLDLSPERLLIHLGQNCSLPAEVLVEWVSLPKSPYTLTPDLKLIRRFSVHEMEAPLHWAKFLLHKMGEYARKPLDG